MAEKSLKDWARDACLVQDACNLSGVAHSLFLMMSELRNRFGINNTDALNTHPLVQLYTMKMIDLAVPGSCLRFTDEFRHSYNWAMDVASDKA